VFVQVPATAAFAMFTEQIDRWWFYQRLRDPT